MFILYDLVFFLVAIVYLPIYFFKKKFHKDFSERFGFLPKDLKFERPIWVHAVSVGEAMALRGLVSGLRKLFPGKKFVFSTVTVTGNKIAKGMSLTQDCVTYLPLDLSFIVKKVVDRVNPRIFIVAETEIWPNMISYVYKKNIPIVVVNGRISGRSLKGYLLIKPLICHILNKISLFCVQTDIDAQRLIRLGVWPDKIKVTGNMKFDLKDSVGNKTTDDIKKILGLKDKERVLLAGSTHQGEEGLILDSYVKLVENFPNLKLIIAPRHPERAEMVEKLICRRGFSPLRISRLGVSNNIGNQKNVFILDSVGQLLNFYAIADIVFVGGSLVKKGGHNIMEPAVLGKPVLFGPHMFNFSDIAEMFLKNEAAILVHNENELLHAVRNLLQNPAKISSISKHQQATILENQGATERNLEYIESLLCTK